MHQAASSTSHSNSVRVIVPTLGKRCINSSLSSSRNKQITIWDVLFSPHVSVGWLVVLGLTALFRQYFSLYRAVSPKEGEKEERKDR